MSITCHN